MNIDLDRLGKIGQEDLKDEKTQKRIFQYLYQLCEQLKYWQYHMEEENMTEELREKIEKAADPDVKTMSTSVTDEGIEVRDKDGNVVPTIGETGDITAGSVTTLTWLFGSLSVSCCASTMALHASHILPSVRPFWTQVAGTAG